MKYFSASLFLSNHIFLAVFVSGFIFAFTANDIYAQNPPVANGDFFTIHGSQSFDVTLNDGNCNLANCVAVNLSDPSSPSVGTLGHAIRGIYFFNPAPGFVGTVTFSYKSCYEANNGVCSQPATVTITVQNQAPVANDDFVVVRQQNPTSFPRASYRYIANDFDPDGDPWTSGGAVTQNTPAKGYIGQGRWEDPAGYVANSNVSGYDEWLYKLSDNLGMISNIATVSFFIYPIDGVEDAGETCPLQRVGEPVNVTNGNMWIEQTDYALAGIGENIAVNRFYNSIIQTSGLFGFGWSTKYDESLWFYDDKMIRVNMPDGKAVYFGRKNTTNAFTPVSPETYGNIIKNTDNTYTLTFKDGRVHKFDATGKLLWQKDRNGNQTTLNYNGNSQLIGVTDAFNRTLTFTPNANGTISQISDAIGTVATYEYFPSTNLLKTVTYNDGSKYKFEYTTISNKTYLTTVKDALDNILETHLYDSQGRATTSEKHGGVEKYTLDYSNSTYTTVTDALGRITKYYFDKSKGRNVITKTEGNCNCGGGSEVTNFEYDDKLNLKKKINALGYETLYTYDANGNALTQTEKIGAVNLGTDTFTYNSFGQILTWTDKMSGVTANTYDANGNLKTMTDALGKVTTVEYPAANNKGLPDSVKDARNKITKLKWFAASGMLEEIEDANNKKTKFTYDARGRTKTVTNALNHVTTYNYFDDAQRKVEMIYPNADKITYKYNIRRLLESVTDERGKLTNYEFDSAYRLKKITDALGHFREIDYDLMSNVKLSKDALGNQTDYVYDDFNRLKEMIYPLAETGVTRLKEKFEYDALGRIKKMFDTANRETVYNYDDANRTVSVTNAELETTQTKYNARRQAIEVKDALNQVYNFTYNPFGQILTQTRNGATMSYEYDEVRNRKKRIDYAGRETSYEYDNLNRLKKINYLSAGNPVPINTADYTYDDISRLKTAVNETGTVSFNYDNRNRQTSTTDVFGHLLNYEYEHTPTVNQQRLKFDGAMYASYNYDDASRLTNIVNSADSSQINFGYDNADRLMSRSYPNGINTSYEYDGMSRLKRLKDVSSTATLFDRQYGYNSASQISQITEPTQTRNFGYDLVNRLTNVTNPNGTNESYNFDDVGNRTSSHRSASYGYQPFNKVVSTATANYNYDANGNMVSKGEGVNFWRYGYDYENRLAAASTKKQTVRYRYDALGRRVQRFIVGGKENTKFIYDGQDVLVDDNNGTLTKYINGGGIDNKLRSQTGSTINYFLADHLGSTNGLTDSSGNSTAQTSYDAFGNSTNAEFPTRYQYTGREYDSFTGLHYYRARFYDANLGRFISEDPIGFAGGDVNLYGYVRNNSQNWTDPSGHFPTVLLGRYTPVSLDEIQLYLGLGGLIPGIGEPIDALDGAISFGRGNYGDAALSGPSMLPFAGWGAGITKICKRLDNLADPRIVNNPLTGRSDDAFSGVMGYDNALIDARKNSGNLGDDTRKMIDPKTGTLIGEQSANGKSGWRIDNDHVNWWNWSGGKKGNGGRYGHSFFGADQMGPHSEYIGYAPWQ